MELKIGEPKDIEALKEIIRSVYGIELEDYDIRIENNIISINGKWLLKHKTEKQLETISTLLESRNVNMNLKKEIRKTTQDFKGRMDIDTKKLLYADIKNSKSNGQKPSINLSYISVFEDGNKSDLEQWEEEGFEWHDLANLDSMKLENDTKYSYGKVRQNWSEVQNILEQYKKFNQTNFEKYFFYGMDNRQTLLEGIIFYANRDLTSKYMELREGEKFPSTEEKIEIWKRKVVNICVQIYRFIDLIEREDSRFGLDLKEQEKQEIEEKVGTTIQQLIDGDIVMFFKRGIFYNDRVNEEAKTKGLTFDEIKGYIWTEEVYKVAQQLEYMESIDYFQYYSKWLQAKISRLRESKKYSSEELEILEKIYYNYFKEKKDKESEIDYTK